MATPRPRCWKKLERLPRYLLEFPAVVWEYQAAEKDEDGDTLEVFGDSDWAGGLRTRRSTSGGVASIANGAIKSWSGAQATIALSSTEAEYYSAVRAPRKVLAFKLSWKTLALKDEYVNG